MQSNTISEAMRCGHCFEAVDEEDRYCANCGWLLIQKCKCGADVRLKENESLIKCPDEDCGQYLPACQTSNCGLLQQSRNTATCLQGHKDLKGFDSVWFGNGGNFGRSNSVAYTRPDWKKVQETRFQLPQIKSFSAFLVDVENFYISSYLGIARGGISKSKYQPITITPESLPSLWGDFLVIVDKDQFRFISIYDLEDSSSFFLPEPSFKLVQFCGTRENGLILCEVSPDSYTIFKFGTDMESKKLFDGLSKGQIISNDYDAFYIGEDGKGVDLMAEQEFQIGLGVKHAALSNSQLIVFNTEGNAKVTFNPHHRSECRESELKPSEINKFCVSKNFSVILDGENKFWVLDHKTYTWREPKTLPGVQSVDSISCFQDDAHEIVLGYQSNGHTVVKVANLDDSQFITTLKDDAMTLHSVALGKESVWLCSETKSGSEVVKFAV